MHKSRLAAMVLDSNVDDIEVANKFWGTALGYDCVSSYGEPVSKYSRFDTETDQPHILVQKVKHHSHVHLDIETDNIEAEVKRLELIGAKKIETFPRWVVMKAPTGHHFCVVNPQRDDFDEAENVNSWE